MPVSQEPRDGDFVAYIEALQRESEARLHLPPRPSLGSSMHPAGRAAGRQGIVGSSTHDSPTPAAGAPVLTRQQADELLARLGRTGSPSQVRGAAIALVIGIVLLLFWFLGGRGTLPFLVGLGLTLWSVSRLRQLGRRDSARRQSARGRIVQLFGERPPDA